VVVFSPEHEGNLATLTKDRRELLIAAWIDRYDHHFAKGADYVLPFESRGREVGVTLDHPHGQIYAFPFVPGAQRRMAEAFASGFTLHDKLQDWEGDYGVMSCGPLLAFVPPFARYPYEVWIASRDVVRGPWDYGSEAFESYAELLGRLTAAYDRLFSRPAATLMSLQASRSTRIILSSPHNFLVSYEVLTK
jgi:UDPglucose--hexose-1-phosphate uridylyltransferase